MIFLAQESLSTLIPLKKKLLWLPWLLSTFERQTIVRHTLTVRSIPRWSWGFVLQSFPSLIIISLLVILISLLWGNKPWEFTSLTFMSGWILWLMSCTILKSLWSRLEPWNTFVSENFLQESILLLLSCLTQDTIKKILSFLTLLRLTEDSSDQSSIDHTKMLSPRDWETTKNNLRDQLEILVKEWGMPFMTNLKTTELLLLELESPEMMSSLERLSCCLRMKMNWKDQPNSIRREMPVLS